MMAQVVVKKDGTKEITYNDNKVLKISPSADILVYKCPHANCNAIFFSQDDLNQHRILDHAEIPKNLISLDNNKTSKYFSRGAIYKLNAAIQREELKHMLLVVGIDLDAIRKPLLKKIKEWLDARRNKH